MGFREEGSGIREECLGFRVMGLGKIPRYGMRFYPRRVHRI